MSFNELQAKTKLKDSELRDLTGYKYSVINAWKSGDSQAPKSVVDVMNQYILFIDSF